jgi:hypothetical protein
MYKEGDVQGDQKVSVYLMITIQKVTSNVQSVPNQSPDILLLLPQGPVANAPGCTSASAAYCT